MTRQEEEFREGVINFCIAVADAQRAGQVIDIEVGGHMGTMQRYLAAIWRDENGKPTEFFIKI